MSPLEERRVFGGGQVVGLPIDLAAAGEDDPGSPRRLSTNLRGRREDIAQPADVDLPAGSGVALSPYDTEHRGEMDDAAAAGNRVPDALRVPYVAFFVVRSPEIQPGDLRSACFECRPEGRSDQPFVAGDQYPAQMRTLRQRPRRPGGPSRRDGGRQANKTCMIVV